MECSHPLSAWQDASGVRFQKFPTNLQLPCGQCMHCRIERSRQWAVRITHEQKLHTSSYFITLTYKDDPKSVNHKHFQDFFKRLRKQFTCFDVTSWQHVPRYFMCAEYGEKKGRPHYHACVFGLVLTDLKKYDQKLYTSETLDKIWKHGECKIGALTFESAQYTAAYCTKKITGDEAAEHYTVIDDYGEITNIAPEYARMSLKPAIAKRWLEKYINDVQHQDHVVVNGKAQKTPRYYDKYLGEINHRQLEKNKEKRKKTAINNYRTDRRARRNDAEKITNARMKLKQRTYEQPPTSGCPKAGAPRRVP